MEDQELKCEDCGKSFVFTVRDQEFYEEKGFTPPKRCYPCRQKKKASFDNKQPAPQA